VLNVTVCVLVQVCLMSLTVCWSRCVKCHCLCAGVTDCVLVQVC